MAARPLRSTDGCPQRRTQVGRHCRCRLPVQAPATSFPLPTAELPAGLVQPPRWTPDASRAARESRQPSKDAGARLFDDEL